MLITVLEERHEMGTKDASDLEKLFAALDSAVAKANVGSAAVPTAKRKSRCPSRRQSQRP